jgi:hypothetical protein
MANAAKRKAASRRLTSSTGNTKTAWERGRDWAAFVLSIAAFATSSVVAYYTSLLRTDDISVVIESMPKLVPAKDWSGLLISPTYSVVFINSGNRPIAVMGSRIAIMDTSTPYRRVDDQPGSSRCNEDTNEPPTVLLAQVEAFIVKEKEIVRKEFTSAANVHTGTQQGLNME